MLNVVNVVLLVLNVSILVNGVLFVLLIEFLDLNHIVLALTTNILMLMDIVRNVLTNVTLVKELLITVLLVKISEIQLLIVLVQLDTMHNLKN